MNFKMDIPADKFQLFQLKVVSPSPIPVLVYNQNQELIESFQTNPSHSDYGFKSPKEDISHVVCDVLPGQIYAFYPVVHAL